MSARHSLGSEKRPLRVAIVGAGPSGFYTATGLFRSDDLHVDVDLFDRLPMPYGLVRGGVAPDHQRIKQVVKAFERTAGHPRFRFFGNVAIGTDLPVQALYDHYDQVVFAVGCASDRRLGIPGEDLRGSWSATEFVGWYNGHPDFQDRAFDLAGVREVVVVGVGNVAMDVTRILARDPEELASTDITDTALEALRRSDVERVHVLGRRGAAEVKFSPTEIQEIGDLEGVDLRVEPDDVVLDPASRAWVASLGRRERRQVDRNLDYLAERAASDPRPADTVVRLHLLVSPVAVLGDERRVTGVRVERNELVAREGGGRPWPEGTGATRELDAQLVLRAIGYRGVPLPGVPFDERRGVIPNRAGRVVDPRRGEGVVPGAYVVGWAKRGPTGLIGTNRADAYETVEAMLADAAGRRAPADRQHTPEGAVEMIRAHEPRFVTYADWRILDALEVERGRERGKVRHKFTSVDAALEALEAARAAD